MAAEIRSTESEYINEVMQSLILVPTIGSDNATGSGVFHNIFLENAFTLGMEVTRTRLAT